MSIIPPRVRIPRKGSGIEFTKTFESYGYLLKTIYEDYEKHQALFSWYLFN